MTNGISTRRGAAWTIEASDAVADDQQLAEMLRRAPVRLVSADQHAQIDIRLIRLSEPPAEGFQGRIPRIVVTDAIDETAVRAVMRSGAAAIISPDVTVEEARAVLSAVAAGYFPVRRHLAVALATRLEPETLTGLTERDRIILGHLARGDTIATIAQRLGCSERHTRRHLRALWDKMGVDGRAQGLVAAARQGLLSP